MDGDDGREAGRFSCFERGGRDMALPKWMFGNDQGLKDAEEKVKEKREARVCMLERWVE